MRKLSIVCFTEAGAGLCVKLMKGLSGEGDQCEGFGPEKLLPYCKEGKDLLPLLPSLREWTGEQFLKKDGIVFIGAAGIAVRAVAPFLEGKEKDPAVVVLDDLGRFSVSLLSGHLGGANELAVQAAEIAGGQAVITTATDSRGRFAVDLFAKKQGLAMGDLKKAKEVSSAVLKGEPVGFHSDFPVEGRLPEGLFLREACRVNVWITVRNEPEEAFLREALRLVPRLLILGIGCRKGVPAETVEQAVDQVFSRWNLSQEGLITCASIDLKKEEPGICEYAAKRGIGIYTFSAQALSETKGEFSSSSFVRQVTGVDNVCERAALACAEKLGGGRLLVRKQALNGVTIAVAARDWMVSL
ncbi:cobalt-precorrin 5A hydrolase [Lachnospiraceae bacterium 54-53]